MSDARWNPTEVLPHRPPMLLLDRILAWDAGSLAAEADVRSDCPFAEPGFGIPRFLALEYMAQAVGALDGIRLRQTGKGIPPGYLLGTRQLTAIDGYFSPGAVLRIEVRELLQSADGLGAFACELVEGDRKIVCQLTVYRPPDEQGLPDE